MPLSERREARTLTSVAAIFAGLLALAVIYVLSLGPMVRLCGGSRCARLVPALEIFYAPVSWLHENTPLAGPLEWYVDRWER